MMEDDRGDKRVKSLIKARKPHKTIGLLYPELSDKAIKCVSYEVDPKLLSPGSGAIVIWECKCGKTSKLSVSKMISRRKNTDCDDCRAYQNRIKVIKRSSNNRLIVDKPEMASQFVYCISIPELELKDIATHSRLIILWKCECGEEIRTSPANRVNAEKIFCDHCIQNKAKETNRINKSIDNKHRLFSNVFPDLYNSLIGIESDYAINKAIVTTGSHLLGKWKCACGKTFKKSIKVVSKRKHAYCDSCMKNGESLFEYELKELIQASLDLKVESQHSKNGLPKVDLYIPKYDIALQYDPWWSHYRKVEQDARINKSHLSAYNKVIRFREAPLPQFENSVEINNFSRNIDKWLDATLKSLNIDYKKLKKDEYQEALRKANLAWNKTFKYLEVSLADMPYFKEFVKNIDHPERDPRLTAPKSGDKCLWKCEEGHEWVSSPNDRGGLKQTKCQICRNSDNRAPLAKSIFTKTPELTSMFIKCINNEAMTPKNLFPSSKEVCLWKCDCGYPILASVRSLYNQKIRQKVICSNRHRKIELGKHLPPEKIAEIFPDYIIALCGEIIKAKEWNVLEKSIANSHLSSYFIASKENPSKTSLHVAQYSKEKCTWKCDKGHVWEQEPSQMMRKDYPCYFCFQEAITDVKKEESIAYKIPVSEEEFIVNLDSSITPHRMRESNRDICIWKCHGCSTYIKIDCHARMRALRRMETGMKRKHYHSKESILTLEEVNNYLNEANLPPISE